MPSRHAGARIEGSARAAAAGGRIPGSPASRALASGFASSPTPAALVPARTFSPADVRLLDGAFLEAQRRDVDYLLHLDPDRLLHTFRLNAGLPSAAEPLGGWEAPGVELRGHTLGHCLTACALMFEATGDERLARRALAVTAEVARRQQARGSSMYGGPRPGERRGSIPVQGHGRPGLPELAPRPLAGGARAHLLTMI